ncbi:hypothetical protein LCGC14_2014110 [marine sediment metagenome]|uniref:Uncharacterized protein n=1 Tax=marine sediment metagenome TaxID=412755 RepID=A0A0F9EZL6_9ZZZZ
MKSTICTILVGIVIVIAIGSSVQNYERGQKIVTLQAQANLVPTIEKIQEMIGCEKIDGKICNQWYDPNHSETAAKWDKAICDQYGAKWSDPKMYEAK